MQFKFIFQHEPIKESSTFIQQVEEGPKVDFSMSHATEERKSTIGVRKVTNKRSGVCSIIYF